MPDGRASAGSAIARVARTPPHCETRATVQALTRFDTQPPLKSDNPYAAAASSDSSTVT